MPIDPSPDGAGILNKPVEKPFPQPTPEDRKDEEGATAAPDDQPSNESLVTPDTEAPVETTRPPMGN